jgi:hypothetical protein
MGVSRFFHVESKSYELVRHGNELRIVERGQKHLSHVTMGLVTARWCHDILLEFAMMPPDQNAFRSFREGNKVFVIQKQRNGKGRFVSVTVLGETKGKGSVIIPEGREAGGWRGFSQEINGILTPAAPVANQPTRQTPLVSVAQHASTSGGDPKTFKEAVILGNEIPRLSHVSAGLQVESRKCSQSDSLEICLKVIIKCGQDNKWKVHWAGVMDDPNGELVQNTDHIDPQPVKSGPTIMPNLFNVNTKPVTLGDQKVQAQARKPINMVHVHAHKPVTKPRFVWRPRGGSQTVQAVDGEASGTRECDHVSVHSEDSESEYSVSSLVPISKIPPITEVFQGSGAVAKTWGSSTDWFIDLRDGRRVRLPMELSNPVADQEVETTQKLIQWVSAHRDNFGMGSVDAGSTWGSQELEDGSETSWLESETAIIDIGEGVVTANPLAIVPSSEHSETMIIKSGIVEPKATADFAGSEVDGNEEMMPIMVEPLAIEVPTAMERDSGEEVKASGEHLQRRF